ncbi:MAG: hypothetical protein GY718_06405, partial [Lentisphaerae bacterium]|nr:hypothetical protein [Lentisphaerota bacterium]
AAGLAAGGAGLAAAGLGWLGNKAQMSNTPNLANVGGDAGAAYDKMNGLT